MESEGVEDVIVPKKSIKPSAVTEVTRDKPHPERRAAAGRPSIGWVRSPRVPANWVVPDSRPSECRRCSSRHEDSRGAGRPARTFHCGRGLRHASRVRSCCGHRRTRAEDRDPSEAYGCHGSSSRGSMAATQRSDRQDRDSRAAAVAKGVRRPQAGACRERRIQVQTNHRGQASGEETRGADEGGDDRGQRAEPDDGARGARIRGGRRLRTTR